MTSVMLVTKTNRSESRMCESHSSRRGMRMQLAEWDTVDTWT